jgi:hypothetical protein
MKKINTHHLLLTEPEKPRCPMHKISMYFNKSKTTWACPIDECNIIAKRREEVSPDSKAIKPFSIGLYISNDAEGEEKYTLLVSSEGRSDYALDVSDNVEMIIDDQSDSVTLCLVFNSVKRN